MYRIWNLNSAKFSDFISITKFFRDVVFCDSMQYDLYSTGSLAVYIWVSETRNIKKKAFNKIHVFQTELITCVKFVSAK